MCPSRDESETIEQLPINIPSPSQEFSSPLNRTAWQSLVATIGLPCIIGVAAIDPGNLEVDLQAGADSGYTLIWAVLVSSILGCILQTLAAHVTICTGLHLAELCQRVYKRHWLLSRAVFAIILVSVIAFDVAEVIGTAFATRMLFGIPLWVGMIISVCDTMLVLHLQHSGTTGIEMIIEGLLFILSACLIYVFVLSKPSLTSIAEGAFLPSFGENRGRGVVLAISIMGSVIMSHNLFLHSWLEKERRVAQAGNNESDGGIFGRSASLPELFRACRYAGFESAGIFFSTFLINTCVLVLAATMPRDLLASVGTLGLKEAGALMQYVLGQKFAAAAWAIALLASGHAATVTGVLASQAICEGFLNIRNDQSSSTVILASRLIAIMPALVVALIAGEQGSDGLAVASQAILSFALPFATIPLFKVLAAIASARPVYSCTMLYAGYVVFSVAMMANVYAVWEMGRFIFSFGIAAVSGFLVLMVSILTLLASLLWTPVYLSDFATELDIHEEGEESAHLLPSKNNI